MLTRLKVDGFKNLVDVDVRFGPFTCVAGVNGVGKSNLFDAIMFLSALANDSLLAAASSVRSEAGYTSDIRNLFHRAAEYYAPTMSLAAEMIIPHTGSDDLGQQVEASITLVRYSVSFKHRPDNGFRAAGSLELLTEELVHINLGEAPQHLLFPHTARWRKSAVMGRRTSPFISTEGEGAGRLIKLHQDGRSGRALSRLASSLPRTVLSIADTAENPTALLARREMQSWRMLQLEPSSLRKPDDFRTSPRLANNGSHLPATLYHLAHAGNGHTTSAVHSAVDAQEMADRLYSQVANRLAELIEDVHEVGIDSDEKRELLTLYVKDRQGTPYPARDLSDGTLRFLALAVLEQDPHMEGLLCLEEPENGIHPERIPAMLGLLRDIAVDTDLPLGNDNPLRQVIINTHSPAVVGEVGDSELLIAERREMFRDNRLFKRALFSCLSDTWRTKAPERASTVSRGQLLAYLNPHVRESVSGRHPRVIDRSDLQLTLPLWRDQGSGDD